MRRRTALALGQLVIALVCALPSHAHAQRTSSLSWVRLQGTDDCIATQALAERVEQRVGRRVFVSASQADLSLEGHVERSAKPSAFVATLVVSDRRGRVLGQRVLRTTGDRCDELTAPLVLVIAIAIDARAALPEPESEELSPEAKAMLAELGMPELSAEQLRAELAVPDVQEPKHSDAPPAAEPAPRAPAPVPPAHEAPAQPPSARNIEWSARLSGELGVLPQLSVGLVLGARLGASRLLAVDLWVTALLPQSEALAGAASSASFDFLAAGAGACTRFGNRHALEEHTCAGLRAGIVLSQGRGFDRSQLATGPWFEPTLYAGMVFHTGRWLWIGNLGAGVPIVRDTFRYADADARLHTAHRAAALVARLELGAGLSF